MHCQYVCCVTLMLLLKPNDTMTNKTKQFSFYVAIKQYLWTYTRVIKNTRTSPLTAHVLVQIPQKIYNLKLWFSSKTLG